MRRLTTKEKLIYSAGNFGNGIWAGVSMFWMVYFFFPPADAGIPYMIPQGSIWMGLTVIGLILALNRFVDAITDPWIANICNKSRNPKGKYVPMMRLAAPGVMLFMMAIYYVPDPGEITTMNVIWISGAIALQALCATMYGIPYYALQVKIAPHADDKLDLNTIMGAFWFTGLVLASFGSIFWNTYAGIFDLGRVESMQLTFATLAVIGVMTLMIPALLIRETDYEDISMDEARQPRFVETAKVVLKDKIFMRFLLIIGMYFLATYMFETGMTYYLIVLAQMSESAVGLITSVTGVLCMLCYPIVNRLGKKNGKKPLLLQGFMLFGVSLFLISIMGWFGIPSVVMVGIIVLLSPYPQAIMGILPGAITADIAAYAKQKNGVDNSSMYMAGNMFVNKLAGTLAMLLFTSLLLLGKDVGDDLGIRVVALLAMSICFIAYFVAKTYDEDEVLKYNNDDSGISGDTQTNPQRVSAELA
ncbi:MAG: MFS transporter [Endozoicomonas sp.]